MATTTDQPVDIEALIEQAYEYYRDNPDSHLGQEACLVPYKDMSADQLLQVNLAIEAIEGPRMWFDVTEEHRRKGIQHVLRLNAEAYTCARLQQVDHPAMRLLNQRLAAKRGLEAPAA